MTPRRSLWHQRSRSHREARAAAKSNAFSSRSVLLFAALGFDTYMLYRMEEASQALSPLPMLCCVNRSDTVRAPQSLNDCSSLQSRSPPKYAAVRNSSSTRHAQKSTGNPGIAHLHISPYSFPHLSAVMFTTPQERPL